MTIGADGKEKKGLSKRDALFCRLFSQTRSERFAAAAAGYRLLPERAGLRLLDRPEIRREIGRLDNARRNDRAEALAGFRRLAFGSVADAVRLMFAGEDFDPDELDRMDLFCLSELKRPKSGGIEIKFANRLEALDKLLEACADTPADTAGPFYAALERGAQQIALRQAGGHGDDRNGI